MAKAMEQFDPEQENNSTLEAFTEFVAQFGYQYEALNRDPPRTLTAPGDINTWKQQDRRKVFLGKFSHRNLQLLYEDITQENEREDMTFKAMIALLSDHFKQSTNQTLASHRFRKITQETNESFETFCIRVKREAKNCNFKCSDACTVVDTMIKDQILFGTRDTEVRKAALKEDWDVKTLLKKGRAMEASTLGMAVIKEEPTDEIRRTKPGRFSRKNKDYLKIKEERGKSDYKSSKPGTKCKTCTYHACDGGKRCRGRNGTCYACQKPGHYAGAEICREKGRNKGRIKKVSHRESTPTSSSANSESESDSSGAEDSSNNGEDRSKAKQKGRGSTIGRVFAGVPTVRFVGKRRIAGIAHIKSRYTVDVIIKERKVPAFCDTGAELCTMSKKHAKRINLDIMPTDMSIRPYGSRRLKKCYGEACCTVRFGDRVANTWFYIMDGNVETLLSGPVSEELGIITMHPKNKVRQVWKTSGPGSEIRRRYPKIFQGVGTLKDYKVKFFIDDQVPPVFQPPRPVPFHLREKMDRELENMEKDDVIEPHHGPAPWVSNVVLAPKDDGGLRVTVDMRQANDAIKRTNLPIPRPEEISSQLAGYTVYSKLDFRSAFHQLEIEEDSRILTVFHGNGRLMRYKRLTMGTTPSSGELNKALRPVFQNIKDAHVIQDDLIVGGKTREEHDMTLDQVCKKIEEIGMTLNPEKCIFAASEIPWWGMTISVDGVSPDPEKVEAIKHMTPPRSKEEVKSLFCMLQSNKKFIPHLAKKTISIRKLLKKESDFKWSKGCQEEFTKIKKEFSEAILLHHYDPALRTEIHVDAHRTGLSALLMQSDKKGNRNIVAVTSRATTPVEARYPQIDLEALAVDFGLRRYRFYIAGGPQVKVITDHKPLCSIFKNLRKGSVRSERIKLRHQDIDYTVVWEKGAVNAADYLSRHATPLRHMSIDVEEETKELEKTVWFAQYSPYTEAVSLKQLVEETKKDAALQQLKKALRRGYLPKSREKLAPYAKVWDQLAILDSGLIMKGEKIVLPRSMIKTAIEKAHQGGHPGMTTLKRRIRTHFWCPKLNDEVQKVIKACTECAMFTPKNRSNPLLPHQLDGYNAWEKLSIDLFGPMPDKRHIIVAQDMVSRFPAAKILNKHDAAHVTKALEEIYTTYGTPIIHRTDNGPPFNSKEFESFSKKLAVEHETSAPYHPQANPVEALMKPLGKCMKAAHVQQRDKTAALQEWLASYRATPHSSTGVAPGDIIFRHGYGHTFPKTGQLTDEQVKAALDLDAQNREDRDNELNLTRRRDSFTVGDTVITRNHGHTKFQPAFGPDSKTVVAIGDDGVVCMDKSGVTQRRHQDDIKQAPSSDPTPEATPDRAEKGGRLADSAEEALKPPEVHHRPVRNRKPNPRYNDIEYDLN